MDRDVIEGLLMPVTYGRHLARFFPHEHLLSGTGLTTTDLNDPGRRITVRQALQYIRNTQSLAATPEWYLAWAGTLSDHFHGALSVALMSAPTLGDGLDAFLRFFPERVPYLHMQGRRDGERFLAELCPLIDLGASKPLLVETPLIILQQYLDLVYAVDLGTATVELDYPATPYAARYSAYFKCPVVFDSPRAALAIPMAWRQLRNLGYMESTWAHALTQCEATMSSSAERTTLGRVRGYLCRTFEQTDRRRALPTLDAVADDLHLAPRTLIRRLRRLGTTYQEIMDDFLRSRAVELLANDHAKIKEVAAALGFTNPANFGKAFKRWFGAAPGQFRERAGK
ncbi:MAG: AraC family transcriptional regulator [Gammaproteobacteria bacterium]|nr:AraC family transcriptional regulator [Gammaproteobacteria bacterium]